MRAIKFKGKCLDNDLWECGWLYCKEGIFYIKDYVNETVPPFRVNPETIRQFTGLHDKDGKEIFEGDILEWKGDRYTLTFTQGMFYAEIVKEKHFGGYPLWYLAMAHHCQVSVIGNVTDNPELLKGGKQCKE